MLAAVLAATLWGNVLTGKGVVKGGSGTNRVDEKGIITGEG